MIENSKRTYPKRIVVVGAGAFGLPAAIELQRRGHQVTIIDPGPVPHPDASSTDVSKIVRMDYGSDEFYLELAGAAMEIWDRWNRDWPSPLFHEDGFLLMTRRSMEPGSFEYDGYELLEKHGYGPSRIDRAKLRKDHPGWNSDRYIDGYLNPRAGWAESGNVVARLAHHAKEAGVEVREGVAFDGLLEDGSKVGGVRVRAGEPTSIETIPADVVVMAAGAWTPALLPWMEDLMWTTGQPVVFVQAPDLERYQAPRFPTWAADLSRTGWYGFPALPDGRIKIGHHGVGTRMHPDEPKVIPEDHELRVRAFLEETFPELTDQPLVGKRLCLYCDTWDGDFWIDHDPQREGLLVASGGSGHGFKFVPLLGEIIADVLERKENPWAHRFRWRERGEIRAEDARWLGEEV